MKTTKIFPIAFIVLFLATPAMAQIHIGVIGGVNLANMRIEDTSMDLIHYTTFGFGTVVDYFMSEDFGLRLEPMYIQKGCKREGKVEISYIHPITGEHININIPTDDQLKFANVELPIMLRYIIGAKRTKLYIAAGPSFSYLLSAKEINVYSNDEEIKEDIKNFDFGATFGSGITIAIQNIDIFAEVRYTAGLRNINNGHEDAGNYKTIGIEFFTGITFPVGKK